MSAPEYQTISDDKRTILKKQVLASLNANMKYLQEDCSIDKDYFDFIRDDISSLPLNYKFETDINMANNLLENNNQIIPLGDSLFSPTIKNQILAQKQIFTNLILDLYNKFPSTEPSILIHLFLTVRKYSLMFREHDEHAYIPLLALPNLEFFSIDSCRHNTNYYPFYNFMDNQVKYSNFDRNQLYSMPIRIFPKEKSFLLD